MARKGITLLELLIVITVVGMITISLTPLINQTREKNRRHVCAENLRRIALALHAYAIDYDGKFPEGLSSLYPKYIDDIKVFTCPSDVDASDITQDGSDIDVNTSYIYGRTWTEKDSLDTILTSDKNDIFGKDTNHHGEGGNVVYLSGEVKWVNTQEWVNPVDKE